MNSESILFSNPSLSINIKTLEIFKDLLLRDIHFHKEIEIVRVDIGKIECQIEKDKFVISQGEFLIINSGVTHKLSFFDRKAKCTYMQIDISKYTPHLFSNKNEFLRAFINRRNMVKYAVFKSSEELYELLDKIENELQNKINSFEIYTKAYIYEIIAFMCRKKFFSDDNLIDKNIEKILPAIKYTEKNYKNKISLESISKISNMDKFYFCKIFKNATGFTFIDYVNFFRLNYAENLLLNTSKTVSEIAFESGFNSIQYFNRVFKKEKFCTPKEYRILAHNI